MNATVLACSHTRAKPFARPGYSIPFKDVQVQASVIIIIILNYLLLVNS